MTSRRKLPGRHETGTVAIAPQPPAPTTEDTTVTVHPIRSDDTLDDWWDSHLRAMGRAKEAADKAIPLEDEARQRVERAEHLRGQAAALRAQADEADRQATEQFSLAEVAGQHAQRYRADEQRARDTAFDHAERVDEQVGRGRQHPAERRDQQPPAAHPVVTPLNAPLGSLLVGGVPVLAETQGFPAQQQEQVP